MCHGIMRVTASNTQRRCIERCQRATALRSTVGRRLAGDHLMLQDMPFGSCPLARMPCLHTHRSMCLSCVRSCAHTLKIDCVYSRERVLIPKGVPMRKGLDSSESLSTQAGTGFWASDISDYTIYTHSRALCCVCTHSKNRLCAHARTSPNTEGSTHDKGAR